MIKASIDRLLALSLAAALLCHSAHAADAESPVAAATKSAPADATTTGGLEEIIVTARKRSEDVQTTPIAITALSQSDLENRDILDVRSLAKDTPSLAFQQSTYDPLGSFIGIRGQQQTDIVITQTPPVGMYVDGVYYPTSLLTDLDNFERVQQIEVLKGPQGTLYGRNTTGGAVNITTKLPDYDGVSGTAKVGYGNYNQQTFAGSVNLPLVDNRLALSITAQYLQHDGYGTDLGNHVPLENLENGTVRMALRFDPTDDLEFVLRSEYAHALTTQNINDLVYVEPGFTISAAAVAAQIGALSGEDFNVLGGLLTKGAPPPGTTAAQLATFFGDVNKGRTALASYICPGCRNVTLANPSSLAAFGISPNTPIRPQTDATLMTDSLTGTYHVNDNLYLKSITAYQYTQRRTVGSTSGSDPFLLINGVSDSQDPHEITEELQVGGDAFARALKWVTGYYYFRLNGYDNSDPILELVPLAPNPTNNLVNYTDTSNSVYGQGTYSITDAISFTGGLRYTSERTSLLENGYDAAGCTVPGVTAGAACSGVFDNSFNNTSYTAGFDWKIASDLFAYAKTSTGFRAGGTNQRGPALSFKPEIVRDYELGLKSEWFDRKVRLNVDIYDSEYKDIQRSVYVLANGGIVTAIENAASARIQGLELEATALLTDAFKVTASGAFTNPKYLSYTGLSSTGTALDFTGNAFPNLSKWQGSLTATYTVPESFGKTVATLDFSYRSTVDYEPDNHAAGFDSAAYTIQSGYGLLDGRVSQYLTAWDVEVGLWARNIANKVYNSGANDFTAAGLGYAYTIPGNPRTYGVDIRKNF
jgi:iron complex outermembrane receptor protein